MVEAKLSQKPSYEALSYRWTDPDKENPDLVFCNGVDFPVGPNLYAALIRFRLVDVPRALWVDQLCIQQTDSPEKAQQLLIMGDIYSKAERVLAWLGPTEDDSDKAMDLFPKLVDRLQTRDHKQKEKNIQGSEHEMSIDNTTLEQTLTSLPELEPNNRRALHKLFLRAFFSRVWTLQELALGNDSVIVCGDEEFPFAVLERFNEGFQTDSIGYWDRALALLSEHEGGHDPKNPQRPINTHVNVVWTLKGLGSLAFQSSSARALNMLRGLDCSQAEDRVYSILRFLPPTLAQDLTAVKRVSVQELFTDLATFELTQNYSMDFLSAAGMCQHRRSYPSRKDDPLRPRLDLPTWVPDWTYWIVTHGLWVMNADGIQKGYEPLYQAAGNSRGDARLAVVDDTNNLCVQGVVFDEIAECVEPFDFPVVSQNHREDKTHLQPLQTMTETQMMDHSKDFQKNDTVNYVLRSMDHLKLQADSCIAMAKNCKMYDDDIGMTTACRQTLIGGMISRNIGSVGGGVQIRATNEEANQLFTEWELTLGFTESMDRFAEVIGRFSDPQNSDSYREDMLFLERGQEMIEKLKNLKWRQGFAVEAMSLACKGRRFYKSHKGFMGLAPDIAQKGDKICLVLGCCTPFIIRGEGPIFSLVGESYVHGVMDGELMSDAAFEDIHLV